MFPALGAALGLLHPVAGGVLRRGLNFQTCTNTLNNFFNNSGNFWVLSRTDCCHWRLPSLHWLLLQYFSPVHKRCRKMAVRAAVMSLFQHSSLLVHKHSSKHNDWATVGLSRYRRSIPLRRTFICPSKRPDRHCGSSSLAFNECWGLFLGAWSDRSMKSIAPAHPF